MIEKRTLAIVLVLLVALSGIGVAAWTTVPTSGTIPLQTNSDFTATFQGTNELPADVFDPDGETINITGGTLASSGSGGVTTSSNFNITGDRTFTVDSAPADIWINKTDSKNVAVEGAFDSLTANEGIAANDDTADLGYKATGTANLTVDNLTGGESYVLVAGDGTTLALATADSGGTTTFEEVREGDYSNIEIRTGVLEIREISDDPQLIDDQSANVTVRLFEEGEETVFVRRTDAGKVPLGDFPDNTQFSVLVTANGYKARRSIIDSVRQQNTIYMLNSSSATSQVRFNIDDRTGDYSGAASATIQIERSINTTGSAPDEEEYQVVAGDVVGGQLTFDTRLEDNVRYRVSVSNGEGDTRQLGAFSVQSDRAINLVISGIDQGVEPGDEGVFVNATAEDVDNKTNVEFLLQDPQGDVTEVNFRIENAVNASDVVDTASRTDADGIEQFRYTATYSGDDADKQLVANYSYVRNGETTTGVIPLGQQRFPMLTNLSQRWQQVFGVGFLIVIAGIFSVGNARIGALIIPGAALLLYLTGLLDGVVTVFGVSVAFSIAVGVNLLANRGVR